MIVARPIARSGRLAVLVLLLASCRSGSVAEPTATAARADLAADRLAPAGRLDDRAAPVRGVLELELDPRRDGYTGHVAYSVELSRPVAALWLHADRLDITRAELVVDGERRALDRIEAPAGSALLGLDLGGVVGPGRAELSLSFEGRFGDRSGLFRQKVGAYSYAYTDFEATDARRAFPCFDDPRFKIPWQVSVVASAGDRAFSNTAEVEAVPLDGDRRRVSFAATRPLPTYLVAVAAGPFDVLDGPSEPVPLRVIAPKGQAAAGAFALSVAPPLLSFLEDYFASPTPYPKIDFIAVPRFYGAMENPGLITFSSSILLVDEDETSHRQRRLVTGVIAHELAHLWFGDLVTMQWWNDLWLNEGFATWMSDKAVAAHAPAEAGWVLDIADKRSARDVERRGETRAVRQPVESEDEISAAFDAITYRKGGAVLAMIEAWLGPEVVRAAIRDYLDTHRDGNARAEDLFAALDRAAGRPVGAALATFLEQGGIPVVEARASCDGPTPTLTLRQRPYGGGERRWQVPVCLRYGSGGVERRRCELLREPERTVELLACPAWLLPNDGEHGYYFYDLDAAGLRALARAPGLSQRERAGLVENAAALVWDGALALDDVVSIAAAAADDDPVATEVAAAELAALARAAGDRRPALAAALREHFGAAARRLGAVPVSGEPEADARRRGALFPLVGGLGGDASLRARARTAVLGWLAGELPDDLELLDAALRIGAIDAGEDFLAAVAAAAKDAPTPERYLLSRTALFAHGPAELGAALESLRERGASAFAIDALAHAVADPATRELAEAFVTRHAADLPLRPPTLERSVLAHSFAQRCDAAAARLVRTLFGDDAAEVEGRIQRCAEAALR